MASSKPPVDYQALVKDALLEINKMEQTLEHERAQAQEPIAIIGMGCRLPGGVNTPEDYWRLLSEGRSGICDASNRWPLDTFYDPNPEVPGKFYSRHLGLMENIVDFDADFFGISKQEADNMDPQHRVLLEVTWHALEQAGYTFDQLKGSRTGVYVGIAAQDYSFLKSQSQDLDNISPYDGIGNAFSIAAGRISYLLGLRGPSMAIETACSSSLVSVHLAMQSLRSKETDLAIAGGVNVMLNPAMSIIFSKAMLLSPDGRCKAFDGRANGYVRAEGCGMIALKRLSDAQRDGDEIIALLKGSALNQDGRSQGITAPNEVAQTEVIQAALKNARVSPQQIDYIEAHGTGTALGDPIEVNALHSVFKESHDLDNPLLIGSVKTNLGHCETAAGIAGIIKVALSLQHKKIPKQLHFETPNPYLSWDEMPIEVMDQEKCWDQEQRFAGVSSFGFSGTNAHVIMQSSPIVKAEQEAHSIAPQDNRLTTPRLALTLSAKSPEALKGIAKIVKKTFIELPESDLEALCYSSNGNRAALSHKLTLLGKDKQEFETLLEVYCSGSSQAIQSEAKLFHSITNERVPKVGFIFAEQVFADQGHQNASAVKTLYQNNAAFSHCIDELEDLLAPHWDIKLTEILWGQHTHLINKPQYSAAACFSLQMATTALWRSVGIKPKRILGHGVGEYTAACVARVFKKSDAIHLLVRQGAAAEPLQSASNATQAALLEQFKKAAQSVQFSAPRNGLISSVTGKLAGKEIAHADYWIKHFKEPIKIESGHYSQAINHFSKGRIDVLIEMGPGSAALEIAKYNLQPADISYVPSFKLNGDTDLTWRSAAARVHHLGAKINWRKLYTQQYTNAQLAKIPLPRYPYQGQMHWFEVSGRHFELISTMTKHIDSAVWQQAAQVLQPKTENEASFLNFLSDSDTRSSHPLFNKIVAHPLLKEKIFEITLNPSQNPLIRHHKVFDNLVIPYSSHISFIYSALQHLHPDAHWELNELELLSPLIIEHQQTPTLHLYLSQQSNNQYHIEIITLESENNTQEENAGDDQDGTDKESTDEENIRKQLHVACEANKIPASQVHAQNKGQSSHALKTYEQGASQQWTSSELYQNLKSYASRDLGAQFQWINALWANNDSSLASLVRPLDITYSAKIPIHAGLIDSGLQSCAAFLTDQAGQPRAINPVKIQRVRLYPTSQQGKLYCDSKLRRFGEASATMDMVIQNDEGAVIAQLDAISVDHIDQTQFLQSARSITKTEFYSEKWLAQARPAESKLSNSNSPEAQFNIVLCVADNQYATQISQALKPQCHHLITLVHQESPIHKRETAHQANAIDSYYRLNFKSKSQLNECFSKIEASTGTPNLIIHGLALQSELNDSALIEHNLLTKSLLNLLQQLDCFSDQNMTLGILTQGAQANSLNNSKTDLSGTPLWGMTKSILLERSDLNTKIIDLSVETPEFGQIREEFNNLAERMVVIRSSARFVPRIQPLELVPASFSLTHNGDDEVYLITGGLGDLGLETAAWLKKHGAKKIVLCGRRASKKEIPQHAQQRVTQLNDATTQIITRQCDVSQHAQVQALIDEIATFGTLRGIFHEAAVLQDRLLHQQSFEDYDQVLAPKVQGTWNLHHATLDLTLDFFVCFSSIASFFGNPGNANYAAANAFLDQFAHYRNNLGKTTTSINWAPWDNLGLTKSVGHSSTHWNTLGIPPLNDEKGFQLMEMLLAQKDANHPVQAAILPVRWVEFLQHWPGHTDTGPLCEIAEQYSGADDFSQLNREVIEVLRDLSPVEREFTITHHIHGELAKVLKQDAVDMDTSLLNMGIDSLLALEFKSRLKQELAVDIPIPKLLEGPSIRALGTVLAQQFDAQYFERYDQGEMGAAGDELEIIDTANLLSKQGSDPQPKVELSQPSRHNSILDEFEEIEL